MHIERTGQGPQTFLGLHGWSGDHHTFDPLTAALPRQVSFFSADLPGCGRSPKPSHWSLDCIADEIADMIFSLPAPVSIIGNCSGALLGILAAQRAGRCIERMVLIDIFAVFPWYFRVFVARPFGRYAYDSTFRNPLGRWITNVSLRGKRAQDTTLTGGFARVNHDVTYRYLQMFERYPTPESFVGLTQKIELLHGEKTFQAVRDSLPRWQTVWPRATATCLKDAGHLPILEATDQLRGILYHQVEIDKTDGGPCRAFSPATAI